MRCQNWAAVRNDWRDRLSETNKHVILMCDIETSDMSDDERRDKLSFKRKQNKDSVYMNRVKTTKS